MNTESLVAGASRRAAIRSATVAAGNDVENMIKPGRNTAVICMATLGCLASLTRQPAEDRLTNIRPKDSVSSSITSARCPVKRAFTVGKSSRELPEMAEAIVLVPVASAEAMLPTLLRKAKNKITECDLPERAAKPRLQATWARAASGIPEDPSPRDGKTLRRPGRTWGRHPTCSVGGGPLDDDSADRLAPGTLACAGNPQVERGDVDASLMGFFPLAGNQVRSSSVANG